MEQSYTDASNQPCSKDNWRSNDYANPNGNPRADTDTTSHRTSSISSLISPISTNSRGDCYSCTA